MMGRITMRGRNSGEKYTNKKNILMEKKINGENHHNREKYNSGEKHTNREIIMTGKIY
jgi:hypothetical protein